MKPHNGMRLPEEVGPGTWGRLILAMRVYRPVAWLVFLMASLVLFLAWMPSQIAPGWCFCCTSLLMVGITRIYVGVRYPRDVLAGDILGSAWGLLGVLIDEYVLNGMG